MDIYDLNIYEGRLRYAGRTPKNRSFEKQKSVEQNYFFRPFFSIIPKNRPKKSVIFKMAEKSAQMGVITLPKKVINPLITPLKKGLNYHHHHNNNDNNNINNVVKVVKVVRLRL